MRDAVAVQVLEAEQQLARVAPDDRLGQRPEAVNHVADRAARRVLEEDGQRVAVALGADVLNDVLVAEVAQDGHLLLERRKLAAGHLARRDLLHGHELAGGHLKTEECSMT